MLITHPAVDDCAVVPANDEDAGEIPVGFVVYKRGQNETPEAIMDFIAERVAPQKQIRRLKAVYLIPKSPSGKILRRILKERTN